jgi:hypothetical protein
MSDRTLRLAILLLMGVLLLPVASRAQSFNGSIVGNVLDPSGSPVASVDLVLTNVATGVELERSSDANGTYAFRNLLPGSYRLLATYAGFQTYETAVEVRMNANVRLDVNLTLGTQTEQIEVVGAASDLNYSGQKEEGIAPDTLSQLPLMFQSGPRASASFAILMPGVTTGGGDSPYDARINGGMSLGDEAVLDGASMQQGFMSQSGMVSISQDFPFSPDMVSEIKVLTSSYEPQYGASLSGQIMAITKSGTDSFHASVFEYFQDDSLNANQWGATEKSPLRKHNFGANVGGPMKVPGLWSNSVKTYFYVDVEGYRQKGGSTRSTYSIPSMRQRSGDFSDWRDPNGNLIPIYDPATTQVLPDGTVTRQPFPGNIIPADRISPLAQEWLQYLPQPTSGGPLNNYLEPSAVPDTILGDSNYFMTRFDSYVGAKDHFAISLWHQRAPAKFYSHLPHELSSDTYSDPQDSWVNRANWDHTFSPNLLSHFTFGYLNRNEGYGCINADAVDQLPKIPGVAGPYNTPPQISFSDGFATWGCNSGVNVGNITTRPTYIVSDLMTWVRGDHTIKFGAEYRNIGGNIHSNGNQAGSFSFGRGATGLLGVNSGNPIASFLLGAVGSGNSDFRTAPNTYARQKAWIFHAGDTWAVNSKLTLNYGLRWDYFSPSSEKYDRLSFLDPNGANAAAGGLPGRLAFAGNEWGAASYGARYPEDNYYGGFAPRLGASYAINDKTVVRAGWGIFYDRAYYPDWGGGMNNQGFNSNVAFNSTLGGLQPAFFLQDGFPQDFLPPPFIQADYRNGQDIYYRALDGNERGRSQQWNLTVDRVVSPGFTVSLSYVGSHGTRLFSNNLPLNAIDPTYLSLGDTLYQEYSSDSDVIAGVPVPYAGWVDQMQSCAPSLAQALLPYPQYCGNLSAMNENHGKTTYNSLQAKVEKRFSTGTFALVSYTLSSLHTSAVDNIQKAAVTWGGASGVISPYETDRNWALAADDVTHTLSAALVWELPIARDNAVVGGWQLSTIFRYSSGLPLFFRSGYCNVPGQFRAGCIPSSTGDIFAQDKGSYDPNKGPLFNVGAFESSDAFNFYYGNGPRISDFRSFSYKNMDLTLVKNTRLFKEVNLQIRVEAFNVWNWHNFTSAQQYAAGIPFNTDISSPDFGLWNGAVTAPRVIQLAARLEF